MWNSIAKTDRLCEALKYRDINPESIDIDVLVGVLIKRGITDAKLNGIIATMCWVLEPPGCTMTHCENYGGTYAFCNCSKGLLPGKCPVYRAFGKRNKNRAIKATDQLFATLGERKNLINHNMEGWQFFDGLKELTEFAFVKKWNSTLRGNVWKEMQRRKKEQKP